MPTSEQLGLSVSTAEVGHQIGVTEALAVIENRDHLLHDPEQGDAFQAARGILCHPLGELLQQEMACALEFLRVREAVRSAGRRDAADLAPVLIGKIDRERDLGIAGDVLRLLRMLRAPEVDGQAFMGVADRRRLWVGISADGCERQVVRTRKDGQDLVSKCGVPAETSGWVLSR